MKEQTMKEQTMKEQTMKEMTDIIKKVMRSEQLNEKEATEYLSMRKQWGLPLTEHVFSELRRMNMTDKSVEYDVTLTVTGCKKIDDEQPTEGNN